MKPPLLSEDPGVPLCYLTLSLTARANTALCAYLHTVSMMTSGSQHLITQKEKNRQHDNGDISLELGWSCHVPEVEHSTEGTSDM